MAKIPVTLVDMAGYRSTLSLPSDKLLSALVPATATLLDLTETDAQHRPLHYRLFSPRLQRVLSMDGTLYTNGILSDDVLRVVPIPTTNNLELELLDEPEPGARLALPPQPTVTIGRGSDNDVVVRHEVVSRYHGEFVWQDSLHIYRDLNSANGSYINNQIVSEPMPICPGSILGLGDSIRLVYQEDMAPTDSDTSLQTRGVLDTRSITRLMPLPRGLVFVSHTADTSAMVNRLVGYLREDSFQVLSVEEIPPGSNLQAARQNALKLADVMLVILTPTALETAFDDWHEFVSMDKPVVVVRYEPCDIPTLLVGFPLIDFHEDFDRFVGDVSDRLIEKLNS